MVMKDVNNIPRSFSNINQSRQDLQRHHICLTDSDDDDIIDEIVRREKIEYEINIKVKDYK